MAYSIETIVPLGRSYDEYVEMFALAASDLNGRILGCADGPASFNAIHSANGGSVVSADPLYDFSAEVRIFPLLELGSVTSRHLDAVLASLRDSGYDCSMETVPYEFQHGGNAMLRVVSREGGSNSRWLRA